MLVYLLLIGPTFSDFRPTFFRQNVNHIFAIMNVLRVSGKKVSLSKIKLLTPGIDAESVRKWQKRYFDRPTSTSDFPTFPTVLARDKIQS